MRLLRTLKTLAPIVVGWYQFHGTQAITPAIFHMKVPAHPADNRCRGRSSPYLRICMAARCIHDCIQCNSGCRTPEVLGCARRTHPEIKPPGSRGVVLLPGGKRQPLVILGHLYTSARHCMQEFSLLDPRRPGRRISDGRVEPGTPAPDQGTRGWCGEVRRLAGPIRSGRPEPGLKLEVEL